MIKKNSALSTAIFYIAVGILFAIFRAKALGWAMTFVGAFFIVTGVLEILKKSYTGGGISLAIGVAIILLGWLVVNVVLLVFGILIAIKGGLALIDVFRKSTRSFIDFVFPALTAFTGLMLAFGNGLDVIILIVGILLAVDGVLGLISALKE